VYFGIRPQTLQVQVLIADLDWVAAQSGALTGGRVDFAVDNWKVCQSVFNGCWMFDEIASDAAGQVLIKIFQDVRRASKLPSGHTHEIELHLHREDPADAGTPPSASRVHSD
jgi:hypothetical protein